MYEDREIKISQKYLEEVISSVDEPIVLLGGWAVRCLVDDKYQKNTGRNYLGSRDIDLGFQIGVKDIKDTVFFKTLMKLQHDLHFKPISFRLFKEFHTDTGEELKSEDAKTLPSYLIFPLYVDLIVDTIPPGFRERYNFTPIDEPLIEPIFEEKGNRIEQKLFGKTIWIPTTELIISMKIKSYPDRDKEHKRIKDICDISALLLFSTLSVKDGWLKKYLHHEELERFQNTLNPEEISSVADILGIERTLIERVFAKHKLL